MYRAEKKRHTYTMTRILKTKSHVISRSVAIIILHFKNHSLTMKEGRIRLSPGVIRWPLNNVTPKVTTAHGMTKTSCRVDREKDTRDSLRF